MTRKLVAVLMMLAGIGLVFVETTVAAFMLALWLGRIFGKRLTKRIRER